MPGAPHCADMPYIFSPPADLDATGRGIAAMLQSYWYNFIATGNPNGPGLPDWPQTHTGAVQPLLIRDTARAAPGFEQKQLDYWWAKWRRENGISTPL